MNIAASHMHKVRRGRATAETKARAQHLRAGVPAHNKAWAGDQTQKWSIGGRQRSAARAAH